MIKARDVYNIQAQMRRDELGSMTSVQALMHQLEDGDWTYSFQKSSRIQVTHLFFSKGSSQSILKTNYEVLIMDCTYKTNKYKNDSHDHQWSDEFAKDFLCCLLLHDERETGRLCVGFATIEESVLAIETF
jgi:hypothetical protein